MSERNAAFHVGDRVIHWAYGLGEIIHLDEKVLAGRCGQYYVVQTPDLTIWVPRDEAGERCLRPPTPAKDFQKLFHILSSPGEPLPADRFVRKMQLAELMKDRSLESICRVIRGLVSYQQTNKINESDISILTHARNFLLKEWSLVLSIPVHQAEGELMRLLGETTA
jgi:RNA polymerase-interacting CarD/CdnL/TRCF family regulator